MRRSFTAVEARKPPVLAERMNRLEVPPTTCFRSFRCASSVITGWRTDLEFAALFIKPTLNCGTRNAELIGYLLGRKTRLVQDQSFFESDCDGYKRKDPA